MIQVNDRVIIIGFFDRTEYYKTLNACILLAKWHIYKNKLDEKTVLFYKFLCDLKYHLLVEKSIAVRQETLKQYRSTWSFIEDYYKT
jgi:hypothetical protein